MKYAVIDIGSNSVRILLSDGRHSLGKIVEVTRISEGASRDGVLKEEPMRRTAETIGRFVAVAKEEKCDKIFAFATEAIRSAENGSEFVEKMKAETGVEIDVVSGDVEANIGFLGAYTSGRIALVDIGGASTELAIGDENGIIFSKSLPVGAMRLKESFGENIAEIRKYCAEKVKEYCAAGIAFDDLYCVGGSASTLARVDARLEKYDENVLHHRKLTRDRAEQLVLQIAGTPMHDRGIFVGLEEKRRDIVVGSGLWLVAIMDYLGVKEVINSETSNTEGYLRYKLGTDKRD